MKNRSEIDSTLTIIENPIRRKIIKRLSQEPSYPLELAKELGIGQQLVAAHLGILERNGILGCSTEASPIGPSRRLYFLKKSVYLTIGFGPHLYNEQNLYFDTLPDNISQDSEKFINRIYKIQKAPEKASRINSFSELISQIDDKLVSVEAEKSVLLYIRNLAMELASEVMGEIEKTHEERRVLHYVLDEQSTNIESISLALNLRESVVRRILESLREVLPEL